MKSYIISLAFLSLITVAACAHDSNNNSKSIDDLASFFSSHNLKVTEKSENLAPLIGASDGASLTISDDEIEVYKFDFDVPAQKAALEKYKKEGGFEMVGKRVRILANGSFILGVNERHPKWTEIKKVFLSF